MSFALEISLFGTCAVRISDDSREGASIEIKGGKHRALFAVLATAPMGRRSRAYLQATLWGESDYDSGHQNLRRALADLRKLLGPAFDVLLNVAATDVQLALEHTRFVPGSGVFLHDLNVQGTAFLAWRDEMRVRPDELAAFGRASRGESFLRPRISALPFVAYGSEPELRVLGDFAAEEICRALSRSTLLTVISHLSGRAMAGRIIDIASVREALGVDYFVTGTLRRNSSDIVLDIDLIDASGGVLLWSQNLRIGSAGVMEVLPERLGDVLRTIGRTIAETTIRSVYGQPMTEIADHELLIAGISFMHRSALGDFLTARRYLDEAVKRAPHAAEIHAWLGKWHILNVFKNYSTNRAADTQRAIDCTSRALDLNPDSSFALTIDGFVRGNILNDMGQAERRYAAALDRNPNESLGWLLRGALLAFQDQGQAAVRAAETAQRLSPIDPFGYYYDSLSSTAYLAAGSFHRALELAERSLAINDRHISTLRAKITAQHCLGDGAAARATAAELMRCFPDFRIDDYRRTHPSADNKLGHMVIDALRSAGVS